MTVSKEELLESYGISAAELNDLDASADAYDRGEWPKGRIVSTGRPSLYGDRMKSVTYRDTEREIALMDERAASLKMSRSDYLRYLVRKDLASVG